jgi:transmembrane sensor
MTHGSQTQSDAELSEQAAQWFVRLVASDLSPQERREYLAWLKASERHVEALLDIYRYHGYGRRAKLRQSPPPDRDSHSNIIPFASRGSSERLHQREMQRRRRRTIKVAAAIAGMVIAAAGGWLAKTSYFDSRIATGAGEWKQALLTDGSVVRLGPNTRLRWSFDENRRTVTLSRGEAVFDVVRDPGRPFIVTTHAVDARALGTEFGVSLMNGSTAVVTVLHGRVAVSKPGSLHATASGTSGEVMELMADQQVVMSAAGPQAIRQVNASRELQWASGYYEFRGETVGRAIEEFNRRNRLQVLVADPAIGAIRMPFTTVRLDDPESFAVMLAERSDVQAAYESADVIRLLPE